jgi:hypothetical protein
MTIRTRLTRAAVELIARGFDCAAPFWQTPREVEWAKAAADGLAEREAEVECSEPKSADFDDDPAVLDDTTSAFLAFCKTPAAGATVRSEDPPSGVPPTRFVTSSA